MKKKKKQQQQPAARPRPRTLQARAPRAAAKKKAPAVARPARRAPDFPVVGIGASAGGLESITELLAALPGEPNLAIVYLQHLDPTRPSLVHEQLARKTKMPVHVIAEGMPVEANNVYVLPPSVDASILGGKLSLLPREVPAGKVHLPINFFLRALAADRGTQAIGVVLSGTGSDGTEGLRAVKSHDGVALVQEPASAKFAGMPESAIAAGAADSILPIPKLADELVRLARHPFVSVPVAEPFAGERDDGELRKIFGVLQSVMGVDFSEYKPTTIKRRLARRMTIHRLTQLSDYSTLLRQSNDEVRALYEDIFIHVTSFFRDPEVFDTLKHKVFPEIVRHKAPGAPVRMWVTGCSTGEEAYSIAIAFLESLGDPPPPRLSIQIFGTDISGERAIEHARSGLYGDAIARDVSPERLRRFFVRDENGYRVCKAVRDMCLFVRHDLARDPPFSKLDLVACRNVLIYFNPSLQRRALAMFHYCLGHPGFLVLGRAESLAGEGALFAPLNKSDKIFSKRPATPPVGQLPFLGRSFGGDLPLFERTPPAPPPRTGIDIARHVDNLLLTEYAPPGVIVNERWEVLQFRGQTSRYLEMPTGAPQMNLLKLARPGLLAELRLALGRARRERTTVRRPAIAVDHGRQVQITVVPVGGLPEAKESLFAVLFVEDGVAPAGRRLAEPEGPAPSRARAPRAGTRKLEHELQATRECLSALNEEHHKTTDDLTTANEELVSSNEELQSMNEELETAKEELQSSNEELTTLNDEMQSRNQELGRLNSDLLNLLNAVEIPILILDAQRRIRRFTPRARAIMKLLPTDVGRPIGDIRPNVKVDDLDEQVEEVIETIRERESEVQDREGRWYRMNIRPYKTAENKIDGAVLSLVDVDRLRKAVIDAEWARDLARGIVQAIQIPLVVLDERLSVVSTNEAFYDAFGVSREDTEGRSLFEVGLGQWEIPALVWNLTEMLAHGTPFQDVQIQADFPRLGRRTMMLSARPITSLKGAPMILLAIMDMTEPHRAEEARTEMLRQARESRQEAEDATRTRDVFLAMISHELRTPLSSILLHAQALRRGNGDETQRRRTLEAIERAARTQSRLIDDLLDVSRIAAGKLQIERVSVDMGEVVRAACETVQPMAEAKGVAIALDLDSGTGPVAGDPTRLQQVVWNLVVNSIKFTPAGGKVTVALAGDDGRARLRVTDTGDGIEAEFLPHIFDQFAQGRRTSTGARAGLGLGLAIVRHVVEVHGGTIEATSDGRGAGATFTVTLPFLDGRSADGPRAAPRAPASSRAGLREALRDVRVLIVDDDADIRDALRDALASAGAEPVAAGSPEEAMRALEALCPDVVVCDIGMPREDGFALLARIRDRARADGHGDGPPVIALTALASEPDRHRALEAGFARHLAKPVDLDALFAAIAELRK